MRRRNDLPKSAAVNRIAISHPTVLPLSHLPPQTHKHMNHTEELARPQKKKADTKTKGGNDGPIPDPTKVEGGTGDTANVAARDTAAPQVPVTLGGRSRLAPEVEVC